MITRTYYKDGKIISEFIPPEDFYLDPTVELRAIATLTQRVAGLEAALESIALHPHVSRLDAAENQYEMEMIARKALARKLAIAESALEVFSECADEYNSEAGDWLDDHWASHKDNITVGDLRRARATLAAIRAGDAPTHPPMKGTDDD
jgi:hypothetical protein